MNCELINYYNETRNSKTYRPCNNLIFLEDNFNYNLLSSEIKNILSEEDFLILQARLNGMSINTIAEYFGFTYYKTRKKLELIKKQIKKLL